MTDAEIKSLEEQAWASAKETWALEAILALIAELRQARAERDWLADELAAHCNAQCAEVYDADGHFCNMCKSKCRFPFFECEDVTRQKWIEEAVGYASCCLRGK